MYKRNKGEIPMLKDINTYYANTKTETAPIGDPGAVSMVNNNAKRNVNTITEGNKKHTKPGRPKEGKESHLISVYVDQNMYNQIMRIVDDFYSTKAGIVRMLIKKGLDQFKE